MTHNTDKVGFPAIPLRSGMVLKLEARNPTTDAEVGGVSSTRWMIYGSDDSGADIPDQIPLYSPAELSEA